MKIATLTLGTQALADVKEQMGHSSIQMTVDVYEHLMPGANVGLVDKLDSKTSQQQNATPRNRSLLRCIRPKTRISGKSLMTENLKLGCPPGIRTPIC